MALNFLDEKDIKPTRRFAVAKMIEDIVRTCPVGKGLSRPQIMDAMENDEVQLVEILVRRRLHLDTGDGRIEIGKKLLHQQPEYRNARNRWNKSASVLLQKITADKRFKAKRNNDGGIIGFVRIKK